MDFTSFCNSYIFPFILFSIVAHYLINVDRADESSNKEIELFLDYLSDRQELYSQLENIESREEFIDKLFELSQITGHLVTATEIEKAIVDATVDNYQDYICLSIGCWQLS